MLKANWGIDNLMLLSQLTASQNHWNSKLRWMPQIYILVSLELEHIPYWSFWILGVPVICEVVLLPYYRQPHSQPAVQEETPVGTRNHHEVQTELEKPASIIDQGPKSLVQWVLQMLWKHFHCAQWVNLCNVTYQDIAAHDALRCRDIVLAVPSFMIHLSTDILPRSAVPVTTCQQGHMTCVLCMLNMFQASGSRRLVCAECDDTAILGSHSIIFQRATQNLLESLRSEMIRKEFSDGSHDSRSHPCGLLSPEWERRCQIGQLILNEMRISSIPLTQELVAHLVNMATSLLQIQAEASMVSWSYPQ